MCITGLVAEHPAGTLRPGDNIGAPMVSSCFRCLLLASFLVGVAARMEDIAFTDKSWKEYVGKQHDPAWRKGADEISAQGFKMLPFEGGELNEAVQAPLDGPLGNVSMRLLPPLIKQDFFAQYRQPTFWPYCESLERCVVYSQNESAVAAIPLVISLPPAVGAIDFYIDLAVDCVETVNVTVPCEVSVAAWPLPVVVRRNVSSICASAQVGQYFGFYNQAGGSISEVIVTCEDIYSRVIGLIRLGEQLSGGAFNNW